MAAAEQRNRPLYEFSVFKVAFRVPAAGIYEHWLRSILAKQEPRFPILKKNDLPSTHLQHF